jgi:lysyl-tRNA synthetase class 2
VRAPAIEPYIEPIAAPPGFLATSPELAMKRLLCRGSGPIFQLSHVFRQAERGDRHSEEFHLLEWYRVDAELAVLERDVEAIVAAVFVAGGTAQPPRCWRRHSFFEVFAATTGVALRGDEDDGQLRERLPAELRAAVWDDRPGPLLSADPEVRTLAAWTGLFGAWSDRQLDPWLMGQVDVGVHLAEFPGALAALSRRSELGGRAVAHRVESYVGGVELANGYLELRDAGEQRARFLAVNALRMALGAPRLPLDEEFLRELAAPPGLPACVGVALGLDRLVMLACGRSRLSDVTLALGAA